MVFSIIASLYASLSKHTPPGLYASLAAAFIADSSYFSSYQHEFIGTLIMVGLTFAPGKWIGADSKMVAWVTHAITVVAADKLSGGPHVNPSVSIAMWSLGKCNYTEMYVRIAAQMAGGLIAFPLFRAVSNSLGLTEFGGPEFNPVGDEDGTSSALSEFMATLLLMFVIYVLNWELNFGKYHYWIKQTLTAIAIRGLIEVFPKAGPAMNPMLGTTWLIFSSGSMPEDVRHYLVYWVGSALGALVASACYVVYAGGTFFGAKLPLGPIKDVPQAASTSSKKKKN
jgi:glycerol uptake facilitator-like aquaporin